LHGRAISNSRVHDRRKEEHYTLELTKCFLDPHPHQYFQACGIDTALTYTDEVNTQIATAIKDHPEILRSDFFVTTKAGCIILGRRAPPI
jgi:hypothetical protein